MHVQEDIFEDEEKSILNQDLYQESFYITIMTCKIIIGILFLLFVDLIYCHHKMDKNRLIKSFQHLITTLLLPFKTKYHNALESCSIFDTKHCYFGMVLCSKY